jgi:hypothetical protein
MDTEGGTAEALGQILRRRLKSIPLSPHKTNIYTTPQLIAMVKGMNFSTNCNKTNAGCTKGITPFATPWRLFKEMNEDAAKESYFEASTVKLVADIWKHVAGMKVELPTTFVGLIRVLNNYSRLVEVLFGAECDHLAQVLSQVGGGHLEACRGDKGQAPYHVCGFDTCIEQLQPSGESAVWGGM